MDRALKVDFQLTLKRLPALPHFLRMIIRQTKT